MLSISRNLFLESQERWLNKMHQQSMIKSMHFEEKRGSSKHQSYRYPCFCKIQYSRVTFCFETTPTIAHLYGFRGQNMIDPRSKSPIVFQNLISVTQVCILINISVSIVGIVRTKWTHKIMTMINYHLLISAKNLIP